MTMDQGRYRVGLFGVFFLAFILRFYQLGQIPVSLYWDEVAMLVDAKTISQTGADMHGYHWLQALFPSYGDYKLPVYIWLVTLGVKIFGVSELAVRSPSALAGILTVVLAGLISKELFVHLSISKRNSLQLLTMLVVAVSPWSIMFSRAGFEGHVGQLILALSVWVVLKSREKKWLILFSPLLGALATYTYFSVRFVWPVVFMTTGLVVLKKRFWKWLLPGLLIFGACLWPMMKSPFYGASNQFRYSTTSVLNAQDYALRANQYRQLAGNSLLDRALFHRHLLLFQELLKNYADNLSLNFLFVSGDQNLRHGTGEHGLFLLVFLPVFLVGLYQLSAHHRSQFWLLIIWWLIALLPASVPEDTPHSLRSLNALVPLSVILGYGLLKIYKHQSPLLKVALSGAMIVSVVLFSHYYLTQYPAESAYDWQDGYKQMALKINEQLPHVADVYIDTFDDRFYLWLLAYGDYSGIEIQNLDKGKFQVKQMGKITFHEFHWYKIKSLDRKILVVGQTESLSQGLSEYGIQPVWTQEITQANGQKPFKIVMLDGSLVAP